MRLKDVRIENFKCIDDSNPFHLDTVTALVGKNEAGKSAILEALHQFNPVQGAGGYDVLDDFPRRRLNEYEEAVTAGEPHAVVATTTWELDDADHGALEAVLGPNAITSQVIVARRGYDNEMAFEFEVDEKRIVQNLLEGADLEQEERAPFDELGTVGALAATLAPIAEKSPEITALAAKVQARFPDNSVRAAANKVIQARLPKFLYFSDYWKMRGEVSITDVNARKAANPGTLRPSDDVFMALLAMTGTTMDEVAGMTKFEPLVAKLEGVSNRLTKQIFRYWSQNRDLRVRFLANEGKSGDPAPFNQGIVFRVRIENLRHEVTVGFDERSTGFVWFFSFLVWFSQVRKRHGDRQLIILLDEPALTLHARAQHDLLRYIKEQLAPHSQVVYTTHSPFMIDPENLLGARTVEDATDAEGNILGTKVGDEVLSTDADTVFPLQAALGYDITQTLFVGKHNLAVEGPSDSQYLNWFSQELKSRGRTGLDRRWRIPVCGGIDKIASFVALFGGNKLHVAVLSDFHAGDKKKVQDLRTRKLLRDGHVFTADSYAGQPEADLEDIIGRANYVELVNKCYGLTGAKAVPQVKPATAPGLVVKEVEAHLAVALPPDAEPFDHYAPAEYLTREGVKMKKTLPELEAALDRFEALFRDLNKLLPEK